MSTIEYTITGMTCSNCERHVREEVERIPGVEGLTVSHYTGRLEVTTSGAPVDEAAVLAAVEEAGYAAVQA